MICIGGGIAFFIGLILFFILFSFHTIQGNQIGVMETWSDGVVEKPLGPGTYMRFRPTQTIYSYDIGMQVFVMNDEKDVEKKGKKSKDASYAGADEDAFHVQSAEGQEMVISLIVQWRIDQSKIIILHTESRNNVEQIVVRPVVMRIVKDEATKRKAIEAYSGDGLIKLQQDIQRRLLAKDCELTERGIIVETFVIEGITLDKDYIGEIRARQVATQRKLRSDEETRAAEAEALKAKAHAQIDYNKRVVEAERDKQVGILKAQQEAEMQVVAAKAEAQKTELAAKADQMRVVLGAEGEKQAGLLKAQAIEALGKAKAEATRLELSAYSVQGSDNYTRIQLGKAMAEAQSGIKGYLPANLSVNVLSENFMKSIDSFMKGPPQK